MFVFAAQAGLDLEVAAADRVQVHLFVGLFHLDALQVGQGGALGFLQVVQQHAGRADGQRHVVDAETNEIPGAELFAQHLAALPRLEFPRRALTDPVAVRERQACAFFHQ